MAVLSDSERLALWSRFMSDASSERQPLPLTKADLRAAVNAIDGWVDSNATAFNTAIPLPARSVLTAKQKAQILMYVVRRRFEIT